MKNFTGIANERAKINDAIRRFFRERGFVEVETPVFVVSPDSEPTLSYFQTECNEPSGTTMPGALITSPEYAMKKLLGHGMEKIFTLTKVFRNGEHWGGQHNPEFTMIEWYRQGQDYHACMQETEELVQYVASEFGRTLPSFTKRTMESLFEPFLEEDLAEATRESLRQACQQQEIHIDEGDSLSDLFYRLFLTKIEPALGTDPVFVHDYPTYQAALAAKTSDSRYAQRFELYVNGIELCNGFTELTNADEQRARFELEREERKRLGKPVFPIDEELLRLLPSITNPTYGNALGVDRLHMILTDRPSIEDVLLFPMKSL